MRKKVLIRVALVTAGVLAGLLAGEISVRLLGPQPATIQSSGMYVRDSKVGYRLSPGHRGKLRNVGIYDTKVSINRYGFRGDPADATAGGPRVLVLGDSFVFGQGVEAEEALPSVLEDQLRARGWEGTVINGGVPGYGTLDEVAWLKEFGLNLNPDITILGIFLGNDLQNNGSPVEDRATVEFQFRKDDQWWRVLTDRLYRHSHLYRRARKGTRKLFESLMTRSDHGHSRRLLRRYRWLSDSLRRRQLARTRRALREFRSVTDSTGSLSLAVLIPGKLQVDPELRQRRLNDLSEQLPPSFDPKYPNDLWARLLREHDIPFLDLTPALTSSVSQGAQLYYRRDEHWNTQGHLEAGRAIARWIVAEVGADSTRALSME